MSTTPPLSKATGYGVVVGLGFLFAFGMMLTTFVLRRYNNELQTSEVFSTAGRTVKSGLVSSAVVSSWTWAATLLQSSSVAYRYGVSGPFWYASGATVQVILFATLAIELKRKAPNAHTFLEAIRARYGPATHGVYITFGLMTNVLVTAMLLTGGSAVVTSLTGVPTAAACFLLPIGVVLYTMFGGIKATFLTDYVHTVMILVIIFIFAFTAYATNEVLGSPGAVYDALVAAAKRHPVAGNAEGSYLTMRSQEGAIFFVINLVGNFGTVFCDNGYYNKAIAASPIHALPGYIAGGLSWFAIPWLCATTMGLSALALEDNPVFPTYPHRMATADVSAGLVLPDAAIALLGKGGAAATLLLIFMAVTSAMSAELIAVSSIWTYDVYQTVSDEPSVIRTIGTDQFLVHQPIRLRPSPDLYVSRLLRCLRHRHGWLLYRLMLRRHQHGLFVSHDGSDHLRRCTPSLSYAPLEPPKLGRSNLLATASSRLLAYSLARYCQETRRQPFRRGHWI